MITELKYLIVLELLNEADPNAEWSLVTQDGELYFKGLIEDDIALVPASLMLSLAQNIKTCSTD